MVPFIASPEWFMFYIHLFPKAPQSCTSLHFNTSAPIPTNPVFLPVMYLFFFSPNLSTFHPSTHIFCGILQLFWLLSTLPPSLMSFHAPIWTICRFPFQNTFPLTPSSIFFSLSATLQHHAPTFPRLHFYLPLFAHLHTSTSLSSPLRICYVASYSFNF